MCVFMTLESRVTAVPATSAGTSYTGMLIELDQGLSDMSELIQDVLMPKWGDRTRVCIT